MKQYIIRRLLQMIPTLIGISIIIFAISAMVPGDYITARANPNMSIEKQEQLRAIYGLDKPDYQRYFIWAGNMLKGNFGDSMQHKQPVTTVINTYVWNSFIMGIFALFFSWFIAMITGIFSAKFQYSFFDKVVTLLVFICMSLPSFFIGLLLIKFLALDLKLFPVGGMSTSGLNATGWTYFTDVLKHSFLPIMVLTMLSTGSLTRYFRTSMLEVIRQDYIRTARAKGLKERTVIFKHAFRNAMIPAITLLGFELPGLFGGAMILEQIFAWPGIGHIYLNSISMRDYPFMLGFTIFLAMLTLVGNLLADVLYGIADPRIRLK
ncbi:ABC transporter permease [Paenibacillus macquariensis]|uniref:Peptide/nickel transport system permease protein n=1 Tax=Paenibacillus macquariensis TaxID=948756 RepID=A0ABY1KA70_9BACL|nr:ABC transporter permease [Paenibacillus macquariensis]MEC0093759.1 ABC transporter permease [Paenibacillus macquariensis]OAB31703.1 diguanylate cyclase [Paenibacillus macquariensis subsp. macquariensis]SIR49923.1 peptide/nickel transport system permease protein [Paenibacillus macquariensis]